MLRILILQKINYKYWQGKRGIEFDVQCYKWHKEEKHIVSKSTSVADKNNVIPKNEKRDFFKQNCTFPPKW